MKYRLDYVTNSSSSSYILALYSEKPDCITGDTYENAVTYMLKELSDCKLSSIVEAFFIFSDRLLDLICDRLYNEGPSKELFNILFQWNYMNCFCENEWNHLSKGNLTDKDMQTSFKNIKYCMLDNSKHEFPIAQSQKKIPEMFCEYIEVYEIHQMIELFDSFPAKEETIRTWFENITGCVWVGCFNYEHWWGDNKAIIAYKMDDWGEWLENEEGQKAFWDAIANVEEMEKGLFGEGSEE